MSILKEIFTLDNLWHSLIASIFTISLGWFLPFPLVYAVVTGIGFYIREASQVDWDWTLRWSLHKHMEWAVSTTIALVIGIVLTIIKY